MGHYIMKCAPDLDLYCDWSTVVDNIGWVGNRAYALTQTQEERIARADATGTSTLWEVEGHPREGSWEDDQILVCNTTRTEPNVYSYLLARSDLAAYAQHWLADEDDQAEALLRPNRHCTVCDTDRDIDPVTSLCPTHQKAEEQA